MPVFLVQSNLFVSVSNVQPRLCVCKKIQGIVVFCVVYTFAGVFNDSYVYSILHLCTWRTRLPSTASLFTHHAYADDTQLYLHFGHDEMASFADQLECCILDIDHWMSAKGLKLNVDKTELLFTG